MDFTLTDDQQAVRDLAKQILATRSPFSEDPDRPESGWDAAAWKALGGAGLLGIAIPEADGGAGMGAIALGLVLEEVGRDLIHIPAASLFGAALTISRHASAELRAGLLPGVADGSKIVVAALSEPRSNNPLSVHTDAVRVDGGWSISGSKFAVEGAAAATKILVPARAADGTIVMGLVAPDAAGVTLVAAEAIDGQVRHHVELADVVVVDADVVGETSDGHAVLSDAVDLMSLGLAAVAVGMAEEQVRVAAKHVSERFQFRRPLATFQAIACRLADSHTDVQAMRVTLWQALWLVENDQPAARAIAIAKIWAGEGGERVATQAVYLHGGMGVDMDYPLHGYFLASKAIELQLGSPSVQIARLGASIAANAGVSA